MMESYSKVTRFCIICNYVTRIIDPITSRCAKFRFKPLPAESITARLQTIADTEGILLTPQALPELVSMANGDLRKVHFSC